MRCPICGSTINNACRFCTVCGSPVEASSPERSEDHRTSKTAQANTSADTPSAPAAQRDSLANQAASESERASAGPVTFSAVMDDTRRRSKRRMPLVVMLALALALAAGTAFAAYQVYVNVIAPAIAQNAEQPQAPEPEAAAPAPAPEEPLTVEVESRRLVVSTMSDPRSDAPRTESTWEYPVLVGSRQSDAIDAINAFIEQKIEQDAAMTETLNADNFMDRVGNESMPGVIVARTVTVTSLSDRYVCFFDAMHATLWGAHGNTSHTSYVFDLETGEQVSVAQAAGMSEEELLAKADAAVRVFYNREGSDIYPIDDTVKYALQGTFYLADEGIVLATEDYALGSYAYGRRSIIIVPSSDAYAAGDVLKTDATR